MLTLLFSSVLLLSACTELANEKETDATGQDIQKTTNEISRNQLGEGFYIPALTKENGYQTSNSRGITLNLNSGINIRLFEQDLMRLSQDTFPTEKFLIQEGQYLSDDIVQSWLRRDSASIEEEIAEIEAATNFDEAEKATRINELQLKRGLNPVEAEAGAERTPRYINSILEFDFIQQNDESQELKGMSIGLAMNTVDYYQTEIGGPSLKQEIAPEVALEQGKKMANEITKRIRKLEELSEIPIFIGIYEQSAKDDLAGGVYVATGVSNNGSTTIQSWNTVNERRIVFPLEGRDSAEWNAFANFQSEVESFFPNLSGLTGQAHYFGESLEQLTINIMTQFYGKAEMLAFTQYLQQSATTFLPTNIDIEIIVESPQRTEAFLKKERTDTDYFSYVFN